MIEEKEALAQLPVKFEAKAIGAVVELAQVPYEQDRQRQQNSILSPNLSPKLT